MITLKKRLPLILLLTTILLQGCAGSAYATDSDPHTITIHSVGEIQVPADRINFNVTISITDPDADQAFRIHKDRESFLAGLLQELDFSEQDINYQPVTMRPARQRDGSMQTTTSQQVRLVIDDFDLYQDLQRRLINNGFDNFSGNFFSSEHAEAAKKALEYAIENAKTEAERMANAAGVKLGNIIQMTYSAEGPPRPMRTADMAFAVAERATMTDFSQLIPVTKQVTVVFRIVE